MQYVTIPKNDIIIISTTKIYVSRKLIQPQDAISTPVKLVDVDDLNKSHLFNITHNIIILNLFEEYSI